ncbi:ribokinase [Rhizobiaceae bacterium BDR2-2]|uniref:Ribokinase n=1 Tax=Ectorhizobium quercum TaxID=2965071 RepID=A0AAE3STC5_9HYPH|nr:ribokinase [Ectorhizobium quercum]MCX8995797.1 ribokinase [Ectorhizobium quercum]
MIKVLGSINIDLIANAVRLPQPGETVGGTAFSMSAGGKGANQALAARRAGRSVALTGATGRDEFAAPALAFLAEAGVDLSGVRQTEQPTGTALITVSADGENTIVVVPGANGVLTEDDAVATIEGASEGDILMLQLEVPAAVVEKALVLARKKGLVSLLNVAPLTDDAVRLAALADIVIANETEFALLAGIDAYSEAALATLHARTGQTVVVTLGADGVVAASGGAVRRAEGLAIRPVDTVGAGDTFSGYLAASLDAGLSLEKSLRRAAVAGSLACLAHGAQPSIPLAEAVDAAL